MHASSICTVYVTVTQMTGALSQRQDELGIFDSDSETDSISSYICWTLFSLWLKHCPCFLFSNVPGKIHMHLQSTIILQRCVLFSRTSMQRQKEREKLLSTLGKKKVSSTVTSRTKVLFFHFLIIRLYQVGLWLVLGDKREHKERKK